MAFPQVVDVDNYAAPAGTTPINVIPGLTTITAGNLLLVVYCHPVATGAQTYPTEAGWTKIAEIEVSSAYHYYVVVKVAAGSDTCNIDRSSGTGRELAAVAYEISGWGGSVASPSVATGTGGFSATDVEGHQTTFSSSSSPNPAGVTAPWGVKDNLFITYVVRTNNVTVWPYADNQRASTTFASGRPVISLCSQNGDPANTAAAASNPGAWTLAGSSTGVMGTIVIEPAAGSSAVVLPHQRNSLSSSISTYNLNGLGRKSY